MNGIVCFLGIILIAGSLFAFASSTTLGAIVFLIGLVTLVIGFAMPEESDREKRTHREEIERRAVEEAMEK